MCVCVCVHAGVLTPFLRGACCVFACWGPPPPPTTLLMLTISLLLQPAQCYPFIDITGVSLSIYIFFEPELRLLFTRLHHNITVDRPGATSVRTVYTCCFFLVIPRTECTHEFQNSAYYSLYFHHDITVDRPDLC